MKLRLAITYQTKTYDIDIILAKKETEILYIIHIHHTTDRTTDTHTRGRILDPFLYSIGQ